MDRVNERILEAVNGTGEIFISHTRLDGHCALRLAIGNLHTTESHVMRAWELIQEHARLVRSAN
jgi:aromatic-L-amino-acid decarboxylase